MIAETLQNTKNATFCILSRRYEPMLRGLEIQIGTGFFISPDGYCISARHVIEKKDEQGRSILDNNGVAKLQEPKDIDFSGHPIHYYTNDLPVERLIIKDWPEFDLVLMKINLCKSPPLLPHLEIDFDIIPEGTIVYSFGYPLSKFERMGESGLKYHYFPRATSAIISSHYEIIGGGIPTSTFPKHYIIDKALNPGNSGGPIVVEESGKVISVCSSFQLVAIPQQDSEPDLENYVLVPSLYGTTISLKNIEPFLRNILDNE